MNHPTELLQRDSPTSQASVQVRTGLFALSGVFAAISFLSSFGPLGIVIAVAGIVVGWRIGAVGGIVVLHGGALLNEGLPGLWALLLLESASVLLLISEFQTLQHWRAAIMLGGLTVVTGGGVLLVTQRYSLTVAIVSIAVVASIAIYTGHRYEQYTLGLLTDD